jgi:two-component system chemotaxis response regulator CheY
VTDTSNGVRSVLVVDDDPFIRRLIVTTLEDVAGFELFEAADGEEAVAMARDVVPAVVLLDINMPRVDGIEACRRLRGLGETAGATIVMLTAAGSGQEGVAREAGADLFLTKPFSPLDLLRLVDQLGVDERDSAGRDEQA